MTVKTCPNFESCRLVNAANFYSGDQTREQYIKFYCILGEKNWQQCKRFQTKQLMGFCPDFVLPDSSISIDEIIDKFDSEN